MEWLIVWLGIAVAAGVIASSKGRSGVGYFFLGLLLPLIGLIIAIGISDNRKYSNSAGRPIRGNDLLLCWSCKRPYRADVAKCPDCGASRQPDAHVGEKKCPACAEWVLAEAKKCKHCGEVFADAAVPTKTSLPATSGIGYCMNCAKLRGYDVPKCVYCGSTGPVIGDAPSRSSSPASR